MVRILQMVGVMHRAGMETYIMDVYRNLDRNKVQFDFNIQAAEVGEYGPEIEALGGKIYRITRYSGGLIKHFRDVYRVVKDNHYNIVIKETQNAFCVYDLIVAKLAGAKHLIAHSHNGTVTKASRRFVNYIHRPLLNLVCTERFACSDVAGRWLFGNKPYKIIKNGRNLKEFSYHAEVRDRKREELKLADKFVVLHVGRFEIQKNHKKIIDIFEKVLDRRQDAILLLVGKGPLEESIKEYVSNKKLNEAVHFLGVRTDISEIMQASDIFVLPSFWEGLPLTGIEAQATGLPCFVSDKVSEELGITDLVRYISLDTSNDEWAECICEGKAKDRIPMTDACRAAGYDMVEVAKSLEEYYLSLK